MRLELSEDERGLLHQMLESALVKLDVEIERTDSLDFKDKLKRRRDVMQRLFEKASAGVGTRG
ncbi:MAG TPA: hypothetical protein GYA07_15890 [Verrucomicrobia bacterium]|nr:hypothetical protein [Verrucomicrobiota bacterium]HOP98995.1 hypothetical protein [Verrucomicrobiota bacterium]HPU57852.1 hypothetical protein [Verrucomicrobiota bacterium]